MPKQSGLSLRAYARHRKERGLPGTTLYAVQAARDSGRLGGALDRSGRIISAEAADAAWLASTNADMVPTSGLTAPAAAHAAAPSPLAEARARQATAGATLAELELAEKRGQLVRIDDVEARWADIVTIARTKLMGLPARARLRDRTLTAKQVAMLDALVREALEELAVDASR
jgi:phage terminase Nu1 subunit (DNA packaging protein)